MEKIVTRLEKNLSNRVLRRTFAVLQTGLLEGKSPQEVAGILTEVDGNLLDTVDEYPEYSWNLLDYIASLGLKGAPGSGDDGEVHPEDRECNTCLLAAGSYEPLFRLRRYKGLPFTDAFCFDLFSEFRCYALILTKFKPRDPVAELLMSIAEHLAGEFMRLGMDVPNSVLDIIGMDKLAEIRQLLDELGRIDDTEVFGPEELDQLLELQLEAPDLTEQRNRFEAFFEACGDLRSLAIHALNFPNELT